MTDNLSSARPRFLAFIRQMNLTVWRFLLVLAQGIDDEAKKQAKNTLFFGKNTPFGEKSAEKEESKDNCQTLFFNQKVKKCQTWVMS